MSEQNKDIVRRYREIYNTNRLDQLDQIMAPDLISHSMFPGLPAVSLERRRPTSSWYRFSQITKRLRTI